MSMYFFDDSDELEEYQIFKQKDQPLELEYEKIRRELHSAEERLRVNSDDQTMQDQVAELKEKMAELERRAPWLKQGYPLEYLLWGPPH
jgi:DNA repair exonuclease SbcCD ATPase subunit